MDLHLLLCIIIIIVVICSEGTSGFSEIHRSVKVSSDLFSTATQTGELAAPTLIACGIRATTREWVRLFCYIDSRCHLYNLKVAPDHEDVSGNLCFRKTSGKGCEKQGISLWDGQTIYRFCQKWTCEDGIVQVENVDVTCSDSSFTCVRSVGCIRIIGGYTYEGAINQCATINAHLAMPYDMESFHNYMSDKLHGRYWVGIQNRKFLDGRSITSSYWDPTQTSVQYPCASYFNAQDYFFRDTACSTNVVTICQLD